MADRIKTPLRRWLPLAGFAIAALALAVLIALPRIRHADSTGPAIGGPFALVDTQGRAVTDADFKGKLMLVYFGYTFCPDVCPTTLNTVAHALAALTPEQRAQVAPIFITVDPARDAPKVMAEYLANFAPDLVGLTGTQEQLDKVEHEYHVYAKKAGEGANYTMDHSSIVYLMGRDGTYRKLFSGEVAAQEIADGLKQNL